MATPDQQSIETFMSITGSSELIDVQKLTEHGANLNQAVNAHFTEGDANMHRKHLVSHVMHQMQPGSRPILWRLFVYEVSTIYETRRRRLIHVKKLFMYLIINSRNYHVAGWINLCGLNSLYRVGGFCLREFFHR